MMKLLLAGIIFTLLSLTQLYGQDNYIKIKFTEDFISNVEQATPAMNGAGVVQYGNRPLDSLASLHKVVKFERVFPYSPRFEKRHRKYGLHLWYKVISKDDHFGSPSCTSSFSNCDFIQNAEIPLEKSFKDGYSFNNEIENRTKPGSAFEPISTNDPGLHLQWHYDNTGQNEGYEGADINLLRAWDIESGSKDVTVAIIDSGIDTDHEDLAGALWVNEAELNGNIGIDDDNNGYIDDVYGYNFGDDDGTIVADVHGTHVAGTVGAVNNNGIGVAGVAGGSGTGDGVTLMGCQVFGSFANDGFDEAFVYAADNGAVIAQNSWGYTLSGVYEQSVLDAIDYFIANAGYDENDNPTGPIQGGLVIFAAGNDNSDQSYYPAYYEPVLAVASTNNQDQKSYFSNFGDWVDISAPGGETNIVAARGVLSTTPGSNYGYLQGTSMSCPHVSGVAGLIISEFKGTGITPDQVWDRLVLTTNHIDDINPSYLGKLGTGRLNAEASLQPEDDTPPPSITDLVVINAEVSSLELQWSAIEEASAYEIRYSLNPITLENFDQANVVSQNLNPKEAGEIESIFIDELTYNSTYYFGIKISDAFGNISELSNVASGTTLDIPTIEVNPVVLNSSYELGQAEIVNFNISNTGNAPLQFEIVQSGFVDQLNAVENNTSIIEFDQKEPLKGEKDLRQGHPVLTGSGSEDEAGFGYAWIDSNEPHGPEFQWEEISDTGTAISLADDDFFQADLPFAFSFYGELKTSVYISSNGFLTFNSNTATEYSNEQIPSSNAPNDIIALLWDDINPTITGDIYYYGDSDKFIVQYDGVEYFGGDGSSDLTFQVILYADGKIKLQYLNVVDRQGATIGIENSNGSSGLQIAFNTEYVEDNLAIQVVNAKNFISSINPREGTIPFGESFDVALTLDGANLDEGSYQSMVNVISNDLNNPEVSVEINVELTIPTINDLTISNTSGTSLELNWTSAILENIVASGYDIRYSLEPITEGNFVSASSVDQNLVPKARGEEELLILNNLIPNTIYYYAIKTTYDNGRISGISNITSGQTDDVPVISIDPVVLNKTLEKGDSEVLNFTIENKGGMPLEYQIDTPGELTELDDLENNTGTLNPNATEEISFLLSADLQEGNQQEFIYVNSNDPVNPQLPIEVNLTITATPKISIPASLDFGVVEINNAYEQNLIVKNIGNSDLEVDVKSFSDENFAYNGSSLIIASQEEETLTVSFSPKVGGSVNETLTLLSNDPDQPEIEIAILGEVVTPPIIDLLPKVISETLFSNEELTSKARLSNDGDEILEYAVETNFSQKDILNFLNEDYLNITSLIPGKHNFLEGDEKDHIEDGGDNMYDFGNYISTDLGADLIYSDKILNVSEVIGNKTYFTAKYPGLFVFSGDLNRVSFLEISGDLGADGNGNVNVATLNYTHKGKAYKGFVKRVYGAPNPSVNHLIIVQDKGQEQEFSIDTNNDNHRIIGLQNTARIYYLLFSSESGGFVDNTNMQSIMEEFLAIIDPGVVSVKPSSGNIQVNGSGILDIAIDATNFNPGNYQIINAFHSNDPQNPTVLQTVNLEILAEGTPLPPSLASKNFFVDENSPNGFLIGQLEADDENDDPLSYDIIEGNPDNIFRLSNDGELRVKKSSLLDFETKKEHVLKVEVSDGTFTDQAIVKVFVKDVYENVAPSIDDQTFSVDENTSNGTAVGQIVATDEDGDNLTFSIVEGNNEGIFSLSASGMLSVKENGKLDFENLKEVGLVVEVRDNDVSTKAEIIIKIIDLEEFAPPIIADQHFTVEENTEAGFNIGQVYAEDIYGDLLSFQLLSGDSSGAFNIASNGNITVANTELLDFERLSSYVLEVQVSNSMYNSVAFVTINISDVYESIEPVVINQTFEIDEHAPIGTTIGRVLAEDINGEDLTFEITSGNDQGAFDISVSGDLSVANSDLLDYESQFYYILKVSVSNSTYTSIASITVLIADIYEGSEPIFENQSFNIDEHSESGKIIGQIIAEDLNEEVLSYTITSGNDQEIFALSEEGELSVANSELLDYEINPRQNLIVEVRNFGFAVEAEVIVSINDIIDLPPIFENQSFSIMEHIDVGTEVGALIAEDPNGDDLSFALVDGDANSIFSISAEGRIIVENSELLDYESFQSVELLVEARNSVLTTPATIEILLEDLDETVTGIGAERQVFIYPNPADNMLNIELDRNVDLIVIFDASGKLVKEKREFLSNSIELSVQELKPGFYHILLQGEGIAERLTFIKK